MPRIAETSRAAFRSFIPEELQRKEKLVLSAFQGRKRVKMSRDTLSAKTGLPINSVCGRVRSLLDKGWLEVDGYEWCATTRKHRELLRLA